MYNEFYALGMGLIVLMAVFSYFDGFLTLDSIRAQGFEQGLPFVFHGGVWSDVLIITPMVSWILDRYAASWSKFSIIVSAVLGFAVSLVMVRYYIADGRLFPNWAAHSGRVTPGGWVHGGYMVCALAVLLEYFFGTHQPAGVLIVMGLLLVHLAIGVVQPTVYFGRSPWNWGTVNTLGAACIALGGASYYAMHRS